jgi:hypothetical protein
MSTDVQLIEVNPATPAPGRVPALDVIFIHGLGGHHVETWQPPSGETWPQRVANAHPDVQVWSLAYPAKVGEAFTIDKVDQPGIRGLAVLATQRMTDQEIGKRPTIFVCHSLGGLLAKRILIEARRRNPNERDRFHHEGVKAVMFCGTPHRGADLANVLRWAERLKNITPGALMVGLGLDGARYASWAARRFISTSDLIKELERNGIGLQHLNEDFRGYYEARAASDFIVRVYAETKAMGWGFIRPIIVVPLESADPNLKVGEWPKVEVLPVTDKDHSELVKPTSPVDWVVSGLDTLIRRVIGGDFDFCLQEGWQRRVGMLIHAELFKCQDLLQISCFRRLLGRNLDSNDVDLHVARHLAVVQGDGLLDLLAELTRGFDEIPRRNGRFDDMCNGLCRIGCILLLAYMQEEVDGPASSSEVAEIELPAMRDPEKLYLMAEILHASLRNWPASLKLRDGKVIPGSWLLSASGQAPDSWRDQDHLDYLVDRILDPVAICKLPDELAGIHQKRWPRKRAGKDDEGADERRDDARHRLKELFRRQFGVVLDTHGPGSPYRDPGVRNQLNSTFGDLVTLMSPAQNGVLERDRRMALSSANESIRLFLLKAQKTKEFTS